MPAGSSEIDLTLDLTILGVPVSLKSQIIRKDVVFSFQLDPSTSKAVGDLLNFLVQLAEPSRTLQFDPPWDQLAGITVNNPAFEWNITQKSFSVSFPIDPSFEFLDVLTISLATVTFQIDSATHKKHVNLQLQGSLAGQGFNPVDLLRQPPPKVPAETPPIFVLDYLGLGQHVSLQSQPATMADVITALSGKQLEAPPPTPPSPDSPLPPTPTTPPVGTSDQNPLSSLTNLRFDASAGWLIGTKFSAAKILTLSAIFNDPNLYGLSVALDGPKAPSFLAGLTFEILYRKVSDNVGVYHIELKLPDQYRQFDVGEASITLPIIDVDIFTNGDFLIDFGYPWNRDFTRSLTVQVIVIVPVIGSGGFYFGVLDPHTANVEAEVATSGPLVPKLDESDPGTFNPIIVFGLAAQLGLGKTFQKGILQAGFSVTVDASLQGVLAVYNPAPPLSSPAAPTSPQSAYFQVTGSVGLTIHVFGSINFAIIRAKVDVLLTASIQIVFTVYEPVVIAVQAAVSVTLDIDVDCGLFSISFHLSFSATITDSFQIGHSSTPPWKVAPPSNAASAPPAPLLAAPHTFAAPHLVPHAVVAAHAVTIEPVAAHRAIPEALAVTAAPAVIAAPVPVVNLFFQPVLTLGLTGSAVQPQPQLVAMLFIDEPGQSSSSTSTPSTPSSFEVLARAALQAVLPPPFSATRNSLRVLLANLSATPLTFAQVTAILTSGAFSLEIQNLPNTASPSGPPYYAAFPMLPFLSMNSSFDYQTTSDGQSLTDVANLFRVDPASLTAANPKLDRSQPLKSTTVHVVNASTVDFGSFNPCDTQYVQSVATYFGADPNAISSSLSEPSMAALLLTDYFQAVVTELLRTAIEGFPIPSGPTPSDATLPPPPNFTYSSQPCDTLPLISSNFAVDITLLQNANAQLDATQPLPPGTSILIPDSQAAPSLHSIIQSLAGTYSDTARSAATFLMHGMRLPAPPAVGSPTPVLSPLYSLTGQQSPVITGGTNLTFTLANATTSSSARAIRLGGNSQLSLPIRSNIADVAALAPSFNPSSQLTAGQLPPYSIVPRPFSLGTPVMWSNTTTPSQAAIYNLPSSLRTQIALGPTSIALDVMAGPAAALYTPPPPPPVPVQNPVWYTQVDFSIRRIPDPAAPGKFLPFVYEIIGTDFEGRNDLQHLIESGLTAQIQLLYPTNASTAGAGLVSDTSPTPTVVILKSNLSTGVHEPTPGEDATANPPFLADPTNDVASFLKFLWECSVVAAGGFTLVYKVGQQDPLATKFTQSPTVRLTLMANLVNDTTSTHTFHNCVAFPVQSASSILYIQAHAFQGVTDFQSLQTIAGQLGVNWAFRRATVAPGNIGIRVTAPVLVPPPPPLDPAPQPPPLDPAQTLQKLYGMLGVSVRGDGINFKQSNEAVPVAPTIDPTGTLRNFDRVLPIAALAMHPKTAPEFPSVDPCGGIGQTLVDPNVDPYGGIGQTVVVAYQAQDVFGNRCLADISAPILSVPVLYRDPLIGLNQWPLARFSYRFSGTPSDPLLLIQINLDLASTTTLSQQQSYLTQYRQIYFQLAQDDVRVTLTTSVGPPPPNTPPTDLPIDAIDPAGKIPATTLRAALSDFAIEAIDAIASYTNSPPRSIPTSLRTTTITIPVTPAFPHAVFDVTASVIITRIANIDPVFTDFDSVQSVTSDLKPEAASTAPPSTTSQSPDPPSNDAALLRNFATEFEAVFPPLRLALGGDPSSVDPAAKSKVLVAINMGASSPLSFTPANNPRFFAVPPLSTTPWSTETASISSYSSGKLSAATQIRKFRGIDLDVWGRDFLSTLDVFLSAQVASVAPQLPVQVPNQPGQTTDAFTLAAGAKATLAAAIKASVAELFQTQAAAPLSDNGLVDAQDVVYEDLLVTLSEAYSIDAVVQFPVTVVSADKTLRLNVQPAGVIPDSTTIESLASDLSLTIPALLTAIGALPGILTIGFTASLGTNSKIIGARDTIASVATGLGLASPSELATTPVATLPGFLNASLFVHSYAAGADDNLRSVIDYLAPRVTDETSLGNAIANLVALNSATPGLFAPVSVTLGTQTHLISAADTLTAIAAALQVAPAILIRAALDAADLLAPGQTWKYLAQLPGFTLTPAQADGSSPFFTTLFHTASVNRARNVNIALNFGITGLERNVQSPSFAPGYESSEWLSFFNPIPALTLAGRIQIPIPLRAFPQPPSLGIQSFDQPDPNPPLPFLVDYEYHFGYSYARAAQDQLFAQTSTGVVSTSSSTPTGNLPVSLAQYASIAPDLKRDLTASAIQDVQDNAICTFATLAFNIANDWQAWVKARAGQSDRQPSGSPAPKASRGPSAPALAILLPATTPAVVAVDTFTHDIVGLNVIDQQSIAGSAYVTRNGNLVSGQTTSPAFVYSVPAVTFPSPAVPLLRYYEPINVPNPSKTKLEPRLIDLFQQILSPPHVKSQDPRLIRLAAFYEFVLAGSIETMTPILMQPQFGFQVPGDLAKGGFCSRLADALDQWRKTNLALNASGYWVLDLSFYSNRTDSAAAPPLLEITTLRLPLDPDDRSTP